MAAAPNPFDQQKPIEGIRHIIAVGSGKGGVGKSTVAVNLASALHKSGARVGLLDADIYGPSIPRMLGALHQKPEFGQDRKIQPISRYGIKLMSIGFMIDEGSAVVWRGPMLFKALDQFLRDINWGELDYLIIDLPPGTGDVQLSIAQKVPVAAGITVCTPQNMALADVKKAIDMFGKIGIPVMGVVENMSYFVTPGTQEKISLFPRGDLDTYLESNKIKKLASIPFNTMIGVGCEAGVPFLETQTGTEEAKAFLQLAEIIRSQFPTS